MKDKLTNIDSKIQLLKQKKERIQIQQALLFMKEAQKILNEDTFPEVALYILNDAWKAATEPQKAEWKKRAIPFLSSPSKARKKPETQHPTPQQNRKTEALHHEHP